MKTLLLLLSITILSIPASAQKDIQTTFATQLKTVIAAVPTGFKSFKGEALKQKGKDVVYASKLTLAGTTGNEINQLASGTSYKAVIATRITEKEVNVLLQEWTKKLISITGKSYEYLKNDPRNQRPGFLLMSDKRAITVDVVESAEEGKFIMYMLVM